MSVFPSLLQHNSRRNFKLCALVMAGIALLNAMESGASAQSGRRGTSRPSVNSSPAQVEPSSSSEAATTKPVSGLPLPKVKLLFARQLTSKHLQNEDVIAASFFKRLTDFINVDCTAIGDLKQAQALARAKSEREAFVVLLKFDMNNYQSGTILLDSPDLEVEYFAFAPRTGKKHVKGKVYFQTIGSGRMQKSGWPNGTPIRITPEAAGIEAAETLHHLLLAKDFAAKARP